MKVLLQLIVCQVLCSMVSASYQEPGSWDELDPIEVIKRWTDMEGTFLGTVESLVKRALPVLIRSAGDTPLSAGCTSALLQVLMGLKELKLWTIKMLDSTGKPGGGQLTGTMGFFGDYDQCLSLQVPGPEQEVNFVGQYCLVDFRPPLPNKPDIIFRNQPIYPFNESTPRTELISEMQKQAYTFYFVSFRLGLCVPSLCDENDIQSITNAGARAFGWGSHVRSCEVTANTDLTNLHFVIIGILVSIVTAVVIATVVHLVVLLKLRESKTRGLGLINCFSLWTNWIRFLSCGSRWNKDRSLSCLNGIRFFSIVWVVLGHTFQVPMLEPVLFRNLSYSEKIVSDLAFQVIANSSVVVQSFFFITGVLMAYQLVSQIDKYGKKVFSIPIIIIHRLWRLIPSLFLTVGLALLLPLIGSGPVWRDITGSVATTCRRHWWRVPLLINNLFPLQDGVCLVHTWYVSAEMQCFLAAVLFFVLYYRSRAVGWTYLGLVICVSMLVTFGLTWMKRLLPVVLASSLDKIGISGYIQYVYFLPQTHVSTYFVGLALGTFLAKKKEIKMSLLFQGIGWLVAVSSGLCVVYGTVFWNGGKAPTLLESSFYAALHRVTWAGCLSWVVFVCATGHAHFLNAFLSWRSFTPLNRLTYLVFLLHWLVLLFISGSTRTLADTSNILGVWFFLSNLCVSHGIALLAWLFFEAPLGALERLALTYFMKVRPRTPPIGCRKSSGIRAAELDTTAKTVGDKITNRVFTVSRL